MKVLVVDDSGVMQKTIFHAIGELGVNDVKEACDGQQALAVFGDGTGIDLMITDLNKPIMNGLELVQALRGTGNSVSIVPIVIVTTKSERSNVLAAIQAGINDYVVKPFERENIREKIVRLLAST